MVERGDATAEDVDTAMELGAGYRESILRANV
jgi:3-hydroxyacyl-CoA dehydrogenase